MKVNPKLHYFVENKIEDTEDTPYILWEEADKEKVQTLIRENASNNQNRDFLINWLEDNRLYESHFGFVRRVYSNLAYRKKSSGMKKLFNSWEQLFPNNGELWKVYDLAKLVRKYNSALAHIDAGLEELTESSKQTKEEN